MADQPRYARWMLALPLFLGACNGGHREESTAGQTPSTALGGPTPSVVNGHPITQQDVRALMQETGLSAPQALRRLQARWLLVDEAERRELVHTDSHGVDQALVQALLQRAVEDVPISDAVYRELYEREPRRFHHPELRVSVHALAQLPDDADASTRRAAVRFARDMIAFMARPGVSVEQIREESDKRSAGEPFSAKVEALPAVTADGGFVAPFLKALFSTPGAGVVTDPVETEFGVHAILVTRVVPASDLSLDEAKAVLEPEARALHHKARFDELVKDLRERASVVVHEDAVSVLAEIDP